MVTLNPSSAMRCPQCCSPIAAKLEQVFDTSADPSAKQRFLRGQFNVVQCSNCGYQGMLANPLVYHDPEKELLLTYVPGELNMQLEEKERALGQLTRAVVDHLPSEARKGYLLQPKEMLTPQGMVESILEADGITPEILAEQRQKVDLLREMLTMEDEALVEFIQTNDEKLDVVFFKLFSANAQQATSAGGEEVLARLETVNAALMEHSTLGRESKAQHELLDATAEELRALGDKLTLDKLLTLIVKAETDTRLRALITIARPLIDYEFYIQLTRLIESASDDEHTRLENLRDKILETTGKIDTMARSQSKAISELLQALLTAKDQDAALREYLPAIDGVFLELLAAQYERARNEGHTELATQLETLHEKIMQVLQSSAPPEIQFINSLLEIEDETEAEAFLKHSSSELTPELLQTMDALADDLRQRGRTDMATRLGNYREIAERQQTLAKWTS